MTPARTPAPTDEAGRTRPRVEGEREREILASTLECLVELGYDRLTFDAVAASAKASKATLYRRWPSKVDLVVEALQLMMGVEADRYPDTGSLRGDLIAQACAKGGLSDDKPAAGLRVPAQRLAARPGVPRRAHDAADPAQDGRGSHACSTRRSGAARSARMPTSTCSSRCCRRSACTRPC